MLAGRVLAGRTPGRSAPGRTRSWSAADLLLLGSVVTELVVLLALPRVVTVDGPAHVAGGWFLAHLSDPATPLVGQFFRFDPILIPNLLSTFALAALLQLFGPDGAEKLLVATYLVLLPLGLRYALRAVHPDAGWLALFAVPLSWNYLLSYGFYNFCLALVLALFAVGLALRRRDGWSIGSGAGLALLLVVTWSAHLLPVLVAGAFAALLAVLRGLAAWRAGSALARALARHVLPVALAGLPVLALTVLFLASPAAEHGPPARAPLGRLALGFVTTGGPLVVYGAIEYLPAIAVTAVLVGLAVGALRRPVAWTPERLALALTFLLVSVAYFASPSNYGPEYGFLNERWSYFPPLFLLPAAAGPLPGARARRVSAGVLFCAGLALIGLRAPTDLRYQRDVAELLSVAPQVPRGSALLQLQLWRDPPLLPDARNRKRDPLRHQAGRLAVLTESVDVRHYEATYPYFPVQFRPGKNLQQVLRRGRTALFQVPPVVDLGAATRLADVVVVVGRPQAMATATLRQRRSTARLLADLPRHYRQVAVSQPSGLAEVWVRR